MSEPRSDDGQGLSIALWQEREILEHLKNILRQKHPEGQIHELRVLNDLKKVIGDLRTAELDRDIRASVLARQWGTDEDAALAELIEKVPAGPWALIFTMHLDALSTLVHDIRELDRTNQTKSSLPRTLLEFLNLPTA